MERFNELATVLERWGDPYSGDRSSRGIWIDEHDELMASVSRESQVRDQRAPQKIAITWEHYVEPSTLIGTKGRLLRDLDVEGLLTKSKTEMAVFAGSGLPDSYRAGPCGDTCEIDGPALRGGSQTEIIWLQWAGVVVRLSPSASEREQTLALLDASLGVRQVVGASSFEYRRGDLHYAVTLDASAIKIELTRPHKPLPDQ